MGSLFGGGGQPQVIPYTPPEPARVTGSVENIPGTTGSAIERRQRALELRKVKGKNKRPYSSLGGDDPSDPGDADGPGDEGGGPGGDADGDDGGPI